jgi:Tfp pilus assembly protein PilF
VQNVIRADFVWYEQRTNEMFFVMGLIDGGDLQKWMDDERLYAGNVNEQQTRLISVAHQLSCGVRHIHQRGILHQDIKPDNVLMTQSGRPVLADLGVGAKGVVEGGVVTAMLRGGTPVYGSPLVRQLFFKAKALPVVERKTFLKANQITHLDDFFAMGATIFDLFAECGWRQGRSVADIFARSSVSDLAGNTDHPMRVEVPEGMVQVLQACLSETTAVLTTDAIVKQIANTFACPPPLIDTEEVFSNKRYASIRGNLGIALYDDGHLDAALAQFERAHEVDSTDARTLNNLGVVKRIQGKSEEAMNHFEEVLMAVPNHGPATFNKSLEHTGNKEVEAKLDRTGAAGVVDDGRRKMDLVNAVRFAPGQQLEVYQASSRGGRWQRADRQAVENTMLSLTYRVATLTEELGNPKPMYYDAAQQIFILKDGAWYAASVQKNFSAEHDEKVKEAKEARKKKLEPEEKQRVVGEKKAEAEEMLKDDEAKKRAKTKSQVQTEQKKIQQMQQEIEALRKEINGYGEEESELLKHARELERRHVVVLQGHARHDGITCALTESNHAPALFADCDALEQGKRAYDIDLKEQHAFIYDLFSGNKLDTRTQMASLKYREGKRTVDMLAQNADVDAEEYQQARKISQMTQKAGSTEEADAKMILKRVLSTGGQAAGRLALSLLLILGPAASGKTTLLKTLVMETVYGYTDFVPILMPVIEVLTMLHKCKREEGESVVIAYLRHKFPQHTNLLLQMMQMRRVLFLVDGMDESGTKRDVVQDFVTAELLEPGHKTIITSRHGGYTSDAFRQCELVELLPLSAEQQATMVHRRVTDEAKAEELVQELGTEAFKDISSNPLMLTMMISIYESRDYMIISNRSELYEQALQTIVGRGDKGGRGGISQNDQTELFGYLQKLAAASHGRNIAQRRIFTAKDAQRDNWAGGNGWVAIVAAMGEGRLPIIASRGRNENDEEEYRFVHMSYQEFLTGRDYYQKLTQNRFSTKTVKAMFGKQPLGAFSEVKQLLVLELLAGLLSPEQQAVCLAVMAGGTAKAVKHTSMAVVCHNKKCVKKTTDPSRYCPMHHKLGEKRRIDAAAGSIVLAGVNVRGGNKLKIDHGDFGSNGMKVLVLYVQGNMWLRSLNLAGCKIGPEGAEYLANALKGAMVLTSLNLLKNQIDDEGAQKIAIAWKGHGALTTICSTKNKLDVSKGQLAIDKPIFMLELKNNSAISKLVFGDVKARAVTTKMTKCNLSWSFLLANTLGLGKLLPDEAQMVAAFLPKCQ